MKKNSLYLLILLSVLSLTACHKTYDKKEIDKIVDGVNFYPKKPNADQELKIVFKAPSTSPLYGYKGEVYIHTGVISEGEWTYVPADWNRNIAKCKMTAQSSNTWSITLSPTVRKWFGTKTETIIKIGVVIRSADGKKKGIEDDFFINVEDSKHTPFKPSEIVNKSLPANVQYGINIVDNSTVTLVLYDKDKRGRSKDFAYIIGDFNDWNLSNSPTSQMYRDEEKGVWWLTISNLDSKKEYAFQYYLGSNGTVIRVGDPYSTKILDPNNDKYITQSTYPENKNYPAKAKGIVSTFQIEKEKYVWQETNFRPVTVDNLIVYELHFRDFTSSGNIKGAMAKLDYLKSLGVNAIELLPVQEFDGNDSWGYNPCYFFAMDKAYGTENMYKEFVDQCHKRGIAVIFDVVYNHATGNSPFARLYWDEKNNRTATYNPYFNVLAPHPYSVFHDFNHESPLVREFVKRNLQYLMSEFKIDGFRFDLTKGFTQKSSSESTASNYDASRIAILKDYNATIKTQNSDAFVILEHFCDDREETELGKEGMILWRNMNNAYCQLAMGYRENSDVSGTYYSSAARPANSLMSFMESHDEERTAFKQKTYGYEWLKTDIAQQMSQLSANAAFFLTVPGPKMIWQFGELGYDISIDQNGRTGRKPILWNYLEIKERAKLHDTYQKILQLRNQNPELFTSTATMSWNVSANNWESGRYIYLTSKDSKKQMVVVGNFTNKKIAKNTKFPKKGIWQNPLQPTENITISSEETKVTLEPNSFKIYTNFTK